MGVSQNEMVILFTLQVTFLEPKNSFDSPTYSCSKWLVVSDSGKSS